MTAAPAWLTVIIWTPRLDAGASRAVRVAIPSTEVADPVILYRPSGLPAALDVADLEDGKVGAFVAEDGTVRLTFTNVGAGPLPSRPSWWRVATIAPGQDSAEWDDLEVDD